MLWYGSIEEVFVTPKISDFDPTYPLDAGKKWDKNYEAPIAVCNHLSDNDFDYEDYTSLATYKVGEMLFAGRLFKAT